MKSIIVPIAADKPEYEHTIPHVFCMNDNGLMLCIASLTGIDLSEFDRIYFSILKKHSDRYFLKEMLELQFKRLGISDKCEVIELSANTASQPETVFETVRQKHISGSILIKDADSYFEAEFPPENSIAMYPLDSLTHVNPQGKSYVKIDDQFYVTNIIERRIIGPDFCVGGYYFEDVEDFVRYYKMESQFSPLYMSHIIFSALLDGQNFRPVKVRNYKDWGTRDDWNWNA